MSIQNAFNSMLSSVHSAAATYKYFKTNSPEYKDSNETKKLIAESEKVERLRDEQLQQNNGGSMNTELAKSEKRIGDVNKRLYELTGDVTYFDKYRDAYDANEIFGKKAFDNYNAEYTAKKNIDDNMKERYRMLGGID